MIYTLLSPIEQSDGQTITEIELHEPTVAEIIKLSENSTKMNPAKAFAFMIANTTKLDIATVNSIRARDFSAIQEYINDFFVTAPKTSET